MVALIGPQQTADVPPTITPELLSPPAVTAPAERHAFLTAFQQLGSAAESIEATSERLTQFLRYERARAELRTTLDELRRGNLQAVDALSGGAIVYARPHESAVLMNALMMLELTPARIALGYLIIDGVQKLENPNDRGEFFSYFRGGGRGELLSQLLKLPLRLEEQQRLADTLVRELMKGVVGKIVDVSVRQRFLAPEMPLREMVQALQYVGAVERVSFTHQLFLLSTSSKEVAEFIQRKFDNVIGFLSIEERTDVMKRCLASEEREAAGRFVGGILMASRSVQELCLVVESVGREALSQLNNPDVNDFLGYAQVVPQLKKILGGEQPQAPRTNSDVQSVAEHLRALLDSAAAICGAVEVQGTAPSREFSLICQALRERVQTLASSAQSMPLSSAQSELKILEQMITAGLRYGILFTDSGSARWTPEQLAEACAVLEKLPEGALLFTELVTEIRRVHSVQGNRNILGVRYPDGHIELTDSAVAAPWAALYNRGVSMLQITLAHELGHGFHLSSTLLPQACCESAEQGGAHIGSSSGLILHEGDPRYDFLEWMEISGWQAIERGRYTLAEGGLAVELDGKLHPIGRPVQHLGENIVLVFHPGYRQLFSFRATAAFTLDSYAMSHPAEDFAEAFAEYVLLPERLIELAPEKFLFLEDEFGLWQHTRPALREDAEAR